MKNIVVFCSVNDLDEKYTKPAIELARLIVKNGYGMVYGGSDRGLMKVMADNIQENHGKVIGVTFEFLKDKARKNADEMIVEKDLATRKATMLKRADAIITLPGGIGTLDEITEILELKKHKITEKPVVILNTENFYEGLKVQLQKMKDEGFIPVRLDDLMYFADSPQEAIEFINKNLR